MKKLTVLFGRATVVAAVVGCAFDLDRYWHRFLLLRGHRHLAVGASHGLGGLRLLSIGSDHRYNGNHCDNTL